jgi:ELWxxDGT repeat protein
VFAADDGINGRELWQSDGTFAGTRLLADVFPGPDGSGPSHLFVVGSTLYFHARVGFDQMRFMSLAANSSAPTVLAPLVPNNPAQTDCKRDAPVAMGGRIYFSSTFAGYDFELWTSDGTPAGTRMVADINPASGSSPCDLTVIGNRVFFSAGRAVDGYQLWASDGTDEGTVAVTHFNGGDYGLRAEFLVAFNNSLYFAGSELTHGTELWKSDGTTGGTTLAAEFAPGTDSSNAELIGVLNGKLLIRTRMRSSASEPYDIRLVATDGTTAGSVILTADTIDSQVDTFINAGKAYFSGHSAAGFEPWVTDGTVAGTRQLRDVATAGDSGTAWFADFRGVTLFGIDSPTAHQIWRSDGTEAGTRLVVDVSSLPASLPSTPLFARHRIALGQKFLFANTDPVMGAELFAITNSAPSALSDSATSADGASITIDVLANDADPDGALNPATVRVVTTAQHGTVTVGVSGALLYVPSAGYSGSDTFTYTVEDTQGAVSNAGTVTVASILTPPVVTTTGKRGGGGAFDGSWLFALLMLLGSRRIVSPRHRRCLTRTL